MYPSLSDRLAKKRTNKSEILIGEILLQTKSLDNKALIIFLSNWWHILKDCCYEQEIATQVDLWIQISHLGYLRQICC